MNQSGLVTTGRMYIYSWSMNCPLFSTRPLYYGRYYHHLNFRDEEAEAERRLGQGSHSYHVTASLSPQA